MTVTTVTSDAAPVRESARIRLSPEVEFPSDPNLPDLPHLFDADWVWDRGSQDRQAPDTPPELIRIREFSHSFGRIASVSYEAEWSAEEYLPHHLFGIRLHRGGRIEVRTFPEDPDLPGLCEAASPEGALTLVNKHVLAIPVRRARVELVRYRPGSRAVLRHRVGKARFFARAMRPVATSGFLNARELVSRSDFLIPRLAGYWPEGAVVWVSEIPGRNVRELIRRGRAPDPGLLLDALVPLWNSADHADAPGAFGLERAYRRARRSFRHKLRDDESGRSLLQAAEDLLDPFCESWRPTSVAHNDFYDDQLIGLRDGRIALVDYEEAGGGDPMLDAGNFLAHLRWASNFGSKRHVEACREYHERLRRHALERFDWQERELALREAVCLFRVSTNTIRHPRTDWQSQLREGLALVNEILC